MFKYELEKFEKNSIIKIFNEMNYEDKTHDDNLQVFNENTKIYNKMDSSRELGEILKITKEPKLFDDAVETAIKTQDKWKNSSALKRANSLHKIWKNLRDISKLLTEFKNDFSIFIDYFDFYSDLTIQTEEYKNWKPVGVVLIVLSNSSPYFFLGTTLPPALAAGCSVIVLAPESAQTICLFLEEIMAGAGLPDGLLNVVTEFDILKMPLPKKINKVFFSGPFLSVQNIYMKSLTKSFSFFCPNNASAFVLESCDLSATVDKIVSETWGTSFPFGVSTVIVQESVQQNFLEKLKYKMEQFMIENKNCPKFKDIATSEKVNKVIFEAVNTGATVIKSSNYGNKWSPTVIINFQNQDGDENVPILKVLFCRTAKEGVALLNNCRFCIGISIWSEISAQALEISSMLLCPNVWINCHGVFEAGEPLQLFGFSGDCTLGGSDGILEFMSLTLDDPTEEKCSKDRESNIEKVKVLQVAASAQLAFNCWKEVKNRRRYLKDISSSVENIKELSKLSDIISNYAHFGSIINFSSRNLIQEFLVVKKKVPVGVILLFINNSNIDIKTLVCLITPPIALGNAIIVVLREENLIAKLLIKQFNNILPKSVLNIMTGMKAGIHLVSDPNIQAIWLYDEPTVSTDLFQTIKSHSARSIKHIWVIPRNISFSQHLFQKESLQNKVVWLTKIDQFP